MLTVHPCIMLGSYELDTARLPEDEFKSRLDIVRKRMRDTGLDALFVYGDAREHGALAYLTNFIPRMRWALALLPLDGAPRLLCSMSSRDIPAMKTMTWIEDVYSGWEWKWFGDWMQTARTNGAARFGTIGFDLMPAGLLNDVRRDLGEGTEMDEVDDILGHGLEIRRPRELMMVRSAAKILEECVDIYARGQRDAQPFETSLLAAEGHARRQAVQDVRTLASFDDGRHLEPFRGEFKAAGPSATGYIAVKYMGFWADAFVTIGGSEALAAKLSETLDLIVGALKPGAHLGSLYDLAIGHLGQHGLHPALQGSIGHAIGLSPAVGTEIRAGETSEVIARAVYTLQIGTIDETGGCFGSVLALAHPDGAEMLVRSLPQ